MTKKINILYDANLLLNGLSKNSGRTGIFFVVYNVLINFLKRGDINVDLYCNVENVHVLSEFISKDKKLSNANIIGCFTCLDPLIAKWELKKYLLELNSGNRFELRYVKTVIKILRRINKIIGINKKPYIDVLSKYDVYFSPFGETPSLINIYPDIKKYSVIYDTIPFVYPEFYPGIEKKKFWYNKIIRGINKETYYFAISEWTKKDFIKFVPAIDGNKITVTHLAASEEFYQCKDSFLISQIMKKYNIPENSKYIFSLCSIEPRKNLIFAVKNFIEFIKKNNINDMYFVLGGAHWGFFVEKLNDVVNDLAQYKDKIIRAGYVDDKDLAPLYSGAFCFIYPSIYEGFGLPPLEAMQCGCPVITSNATSLPEVINGAGIMINPENSDELISALEKFYNNTALRQEYALKGINRAKEFSWDKTVDIMTKKMFEVYSENTSRLS